MSRIVRRFTTPTIVRHGHVNWSIERPPRAELIFYFSKTSTQSRVNLLKNSHEHATLTVLALSTLY